MTAVALILAAIALLGWLYFRRKGDTGLPTGSLVYEDAGRHHLEGPLVSHRYALTGKPDYLIQTDDGLVPVELKSANCPRSGPYEAHIAQLTAYCLLVEDVLGKRVPYGILQYADTQLRIPYSEAQRQRLIELADDIRMCLEAEDVHRDHRHAGRLHDHS
ncbi:MAG: CRISPR-associated protein Cas4 [Bryobacteraceae bacterium]